MDIIGKRVIDPGLQKLYDEKKKVYSISRLNTIDNCEYEAWNVYINHDRGKSSIYGIMGSKVHDALESIVLGEQTEECLIKALQKELADMEMLNIDFPKDFRGGNSIRESWIADMTHFCLNFKKPSGRFTTEKLIIYKLNESRYLQGYIDLIRHNEDGSVSIYDWKTSGRFKKEDLLHHGRQLVVYALALAQKGYKVSDVGWIMLKYVEVTFKGKARKNSKKESKITKVISRRNIVKELYSYLEHDLLAGGLDELEIDILMNEAVKTNSLDGLPDQVKEKYRIKPYVLNYEITDDINAETLGYINKMAELYESKGAGSKEWEPRSFVNEKGKSDTFYCYNLCSQREKCIHLQRYRELQDIMKADDSDLF